MIRLLGRAFFHAYTETTDQCDNLISCSGNDLPPLRFQAQPGGEVIFKINPGFDAIDSFTLVQ